MGWIKYCALIDSTMILIITAQTCMWLCVRDWKLQNLTFQVTASYTKLNHCILNKVIKHLFDMRKMEYSVVMSVGQRKKSSSLTGIEPMTFRTPVWRSNHWATGRLMPSEVIFTQFIVTRDLHTARISNAKSTMCDNKERYSVDGNFKLRKKRERWNIQLSWTWDKEKIWEPDGNQTRDLLYTCWVL